MGRNKDELFIAILLVTDLLGYAYYRWTVAQLNRKYGPNAFERHDALASRDNTEESN